MFAKFFRSVKEKLIPPNKIQKAIPPKVEVIKTPVKYATPSAKRKKPFSITHGRKEAGCKWWPEIGKGYVLQIRKTRRGAFRYLVAFPFLGAHLDRKKGKWVGLLKGCLWLPESELS